MKRLAICDPECWVLGEGRLRSDPLRLLIASLAFVLLLAGGIASDRIGMLPRGSGWLIGLVAGGLTAGLFRPRLRIDLTAGADAPILSLRQRGGLVRTRFLASDPDGQVLGTLTGPRPLAWRPAWQALDPTGARLFRLRSDSWLSALLLGDGGPPWTSLLLHRSCSLLDRDGRRIGGLRSSWHRSEWWLELEEVDAPLPDRRLILACALAGILGGEV